MVKRADWDTLLSYDTLKFVTIKDYRLGLLHYICTLAILGYVLGYEILYNKTFLVTEQPTAAIRLSLSDPPSPPTAPSDYCRAVNACVFWPSERIGFNPDGNTLLITTNVRVREYIQDCADTNFTCEETLVSSNTYLINNIENFVISLDHSPRSPNLELGITGTLHGAMQKESPVGSGDWSDYATYAQTGPDLFTVADLLDAANVDLEAAGNSYDLSGNNSTEQTYRQYGAVILNLIKYDNIRDFYVAPKAIYYQYRPSLIEDIDSFETQNLWVDFPHRHFRLERRGIRLVCLPNGLLGAFQFQQLLLSLTTSLALIKIVATIVDTLATKILPMKGVYNKAKYDVTEDFSIIRARLKQEKLAKLAAASPEKLDPNLEPMTADEFSEQMSEMMRQIELLERAQARSLDIQARRSSAVGGGGGDSGVNIEMRPLPSRNNLYNAE